jgi:polyisoprenoid-binding protein YceI
MRKIAAALALILLLAAPAYADALAYRLDRRHAALHFTLGRMDGAFADFDAALVFDRARPEEARLDVLIRSASVDAGGATPLVRDAFEARRYPYIRFVSTRVEPGANSSARIEGLLTLRGVTHPIVLDATMNEDGPLRFVASGAFRRSAFGIGGWPWTADRVELRIEAPFSPA